MKMISNFKRNAAAGMIAVASFAAPLTASANFWDLDFGDYINPGSWQPAPNQAIADQYTTASTLYFFNVAGGSDLGISVNLKVTAESYVSSNHANARYSYLGSFPDYRKASGVNQPDGDLGFLYQYNAAGGGGGGGASRQNPAVGGIRYTFEFFQAGVDDREIETAFSTIFEIPSLRLLAYDIDSDNPSGGNPSVQVEGVRTYLEDGFYGYYVAKENPLIATLEDGNASYFFRNSGAGDRPEDSPEGAVVLLFAGTSKLTLELEASTYSNTTNGVFGAIDGDLSLIAGDLSGFDYTQVAVPVPEPATYALLGAGAALGLWMRRRNRRG